MEVISVFYSTTEDEATIKYEPVFKEIADQVGHLLDVYLQVIYWREVAGGLGPTAQNVIDDRIAGKYQIYFGVMGANFGKGTAHEYEKAVEAFRTKGKPNYVCFGFCEEKVNPFRLNADSITNLLQFRKDIGSDGKFGLANLYFTFDDESTFRRKAADHLKHGIEVVKSRVAGGKTFTGT
jgi:hypothetical protein